MDDATAGVKSTEELQRDMQQTRESITEKVTALENQVMGTIQTAADTVTNTVDAVKDAVSNTPQAVSDSVKQTVDSVKQTFQDAIGSLSLTGAVTRNPWASLGATAFVGFLAGRWLSRREGPSNFAGEQTSGRARSERSRDDRAERPSNYAGRHIASEQPREEPQAPQSQGIFGEVSGMVGKELRELAEQGLRTVLDSLKKSLGEQVPQAVDAAVHRVTDPIQNAARRATTVSTNGYR